MHPIIQQDILLWSGYTAVEVDSDSDCETVCQTNACNVANYIASTKTCLVTSGKKVRRINSNPALGIKGGNCDVTKIYQISFLKQFKISNFRVLIAILNPTSCFCPKFCLNILQVKIKWDQLSNVSCFVIWLGWPIVQLLFFTMMMMILKENEMLVHFTISRIL